MEKDTSSRPDAADYLHDKERIAAYLEAVIAESGNDPAFIARALGTIARRRSMSRLARETGVTREGLYKALSGEGNPSFATVLKVAKALGLKMSFRPIAV